jgi:hypothetical protein
MALAELAAEIAPLLEQRQPAEGVEREVLQQLANRIRSEDRAVRPRRQLVRVGRPARELGSFTCDRGGIDVSNRPRGLLRVARGAVGCGEREGHGVRGGLLAGKPGRGDDRNGCRAAREEPVDRHLTGPGDRIGGEPSLVGRSESGGLLVVAVDVGELRGAGQRVQIRIFGRSFGSLARPERELAEAIVVDQVGSGRADAVPADHAQEDADVLDQSRLVHLRSGKSREARVLGLDDRFGAVALRRGNCPLGEVDRARHDGATPTWTFRNRAGAAPWLTCACWPGCPLPQLVRP